MTRWAATVTGFLVLWLLLGRGWAVAMLAAVAAAIWLTRGDTKRERRRRRNLAQIVGPAWVQRCTYCGDPADSWDHIVPFSAGGSDHYQNLTPACTRCNSSKNDSCPEDWWGRIGNGAPYPNSWPRTR